MCIFPSFFYYISKYSHILCYFSFFLCCVICLFAIKYHFDIIILIHNVYIYITSIKSIQTNQHFLQHFYVYHFPFIYFLLSFHFLCLIRIVNVCWILLSYKCIKGKGNIWVFSFLCEKIGYWIILKLKGNSHCEERICRR